MNVCSNCVHSDVDEHDKEGACFWCFRMTQHVRDTLTPCKVEELLTFHRTKEDG